MKRVIIIGCPGSGKSTLARKLSKKTDLPLFYLDMIWHKADKTNVSREEFDSRLNEILAKDEWIIDGNYSRTLSVRFEKCDTVIFLDIPTEECIKAAEGRVGTKREDMPWVEESFDDEFRQFIRSFNETAKPKIEGLIEEYRGSREIFVFKSREEAVLFL